jgi:hypothetical protein
MSIGRVENNLAGVAVGTIGPSILIPGISTIDQIIMQNPIDQAENFIPAETTVMGINAPNLNRAFTVRWKSCQALRILVLQAA